MSGQGKNLNMSEPNEILTRPRDDNYSSLDFFFFGAQSDFDARASSSVDTCKKYVL